MSGTPLDPEVMGVLVMTTDTDGEQSIQLFSPDRMYITLEPNETPDAWGHVCAELALDPDRRVLGVVADAGAI